MSGGGGVSIRDAASVVALRESGGGSSVLMGRRGAAAAFMPNKFVFPGGALDADDRAVPLAGPLAAPCERRLRAAGGTAPPEGLAAAAIRELREETGLVLGAPGDWPGEAPPGWRDFAAAGLLPAANRLRFVFRAITPPGLARRFDARFFLADARHLAGDLDDFSAASGELSDLRWIPLEETLGHDLPSITRIVLAEIAQRAGDPDADRPAPFADGGSAGAIRLLE